MAALDSFPAGSWTLYFHDPDNTSWTPDSYQALGTFTTFSGLWGAMKRIGDAKLLTGMYFMMRGTSMPLWENRANIRGGSYSIKVPERTAHETYMRYMAAGILGVVGRDPENQIVGICISPKKGFHILKIWNTDAKAFHKSTDIQVLGDGMLLTDVIYRPHVDQKM
jgi:hypothetical protein